jgi:hypothetical protein
MTAPLTDPLCMRRRVMPPSASQEEVFAEIKGVVNSVVDGKRACVLAYGAVRSRYLPVFCQVPTSIPPSLPPSPSTCCSVLWFEPRVNDKA